MNPVLSIIMPVFNTAQFLRQSIEAIINQTFTEWELILVNDGSTDDSKLICEEYEKNDARIRFVDKKNEGAGPTRNAGIAVARGEYLAFPDSDDWLEPNAYEVCMNILKVKKVDLLVFGSITEVYDNLTHEVTQSIPDQNVEYYFDNKVECRHNWPHMYQSLSMNGPWNKIYSMDVIKKYNIAYPSLRRMQDGVFNMLYFDKISSFVSIQDNFYHRRWHTDEYQKKKMPKNFIECAIEYHKTITQTIDSWGIILPEDYLFFDEEFSEIIMTGVFEYLTNEKSSMFDIYRHMQSITMQPYIHGFYKRLLSKKGKLRKKEKVVFSQCNLLLTLYVFLKIK